MISLLMSRLVRGAHRLPVERRTPVQARGSVSEGMRSASENCVHAELPSTQPEFHSAMHRHGVAHSLKSAATQSMSVKKHLGRLNKKHGSESTRTARASVRLPCVCFATSVLFHIVRCGPPLSVSSAALSQVVVDVECNIRVGFQRSMVQLLLFAPCPPATP